MCSKLSATFYPLISPCIGSCSSSTFSPTFGMGSLLNFSHSNRNVMIRHFSFICTFLITNCDGHLSMCLFDISVSSLVKCSVQIFCLYLNWIVSLIPSFEISFTYQVNVLFTKIFSQAVVYLFILLTIFKEKKFSILIKFNFFNGLCFWSYI